MSQSRDGHWYRTGFPKQSMFLMMSSSKTFKNVSDSVCLCWFMNFRFPLWCPAQNIGSWQVPRAQSMLQSQYYAHLKEFSAKMLSENPSMSKRKALDEARKMWEPQLLVSVHTHATRLNWVPNPLRCITILLLMLLVPSSAPQASQSWF